MWRPQRAEMNAAIEFNLLPITHPKRLSLIIISCGCLGLQLLVPGAVIG
jgi:hypothetical protein